MNYPSTSYIGSPLSYRVLVPEMYVPYFMLILSIQGTTWCCSVWAWGYAHWLGPCCEQVWAYCPVTRFPVLWTGRTISSDNLLLRIVLTCKIKTTTFFPTFFRIFKNKSVILFFLRKIYVNTFKYCRPSVWTWQALGLPPSACHWLPHRPHLKPRAAVPPPMD